MHKMDDRGVMLNASFAVSAAWVFAGHLAFALAFPGGEDYALSMIVAKLTAGVLAIFLAILLSKRTLSIGQEDACPPEKISA